MREALERDLEAARFAADRAFRQYDAADPANRLVAGELEARWNKALEHVAEVEGKIAVHDATTPTPAADPASFVALAADLKSVWTAPSTDARLKKRIVRTVIHEVIADIDQEAAEIVLIVHWIGGVHSEIRLPRRRRGQRNSTSADVIAAVRQLVLIADDDLIAGILNRNGLVTGNGNRWTRERVTSLRSHHRIPVHKPAEDGVEPWLQLNKAAQFLHIAAKTLRRAAEAGEIRRDPSLAGWSVDLQPRRSLHPGSPNHHGTRAAEPETPRGIASRSTKPVFFNDIDRWVFRCAVVVGGPGADDLPGVPKAEEQGLVQQLVAHSSVEGFDEAVLHRLAGRDVMPVDAVLGAPGEDGVRGQLGSVIRYDHGWLAPPFDQCRQFPGHPLARYRGVGHGRQTFPRHVVDDVEDAEAPATGELVVHEVERPAGIYLGLDQDRRPHADSTPPGPAPAHRQTFLAIEPVDAVDAAGLALAAQ